MKAIDTPEDTTGHAHALVDEGIEAVGFYLRPDRASKAMVDGLALVGIKRFCVFEKGHPTSGAYFTLAQGAHDASAAVAFAMQIGVLPGAQIFFAVDYDASPSEIRGPVQRYFAQAQQIVKAAGYLCSVYGSGAVCQFLMSAGIAHSGWLAQSKGWAGYSGFKGSCSILQGVETTVLGFDVDLDEVRDEGAVW